MASHTCRLCGRTSSRGLRQSGHDPAVWMCTSAGACVRRHQEEQRAAAEDPRWRHLQAAAIAGLHPCDETVSTHTCSIAYATAILAGYDLDDWDWLVHELAAAMDEAAIDAADEWLALQQPGLKAACHLPRPCPCGRWPDFGTGCYYHGPCRCVTTEVAYASLETYCATRTVLAYPGWRYLHAYDPPPVLDRSCPVHPDGPMPAQVFRRWLAAAWHECGLALTLDPPVAQIARYEANERRTGRLA